MIYAGVPISEDDTRPVVGAAAIQVYYSDGYKLGGAAIAVHVVTDAEIASGLYSISGGSPIPVYANPTGNPVQGGSAIPVYVI